MEFSKIILNGKLLAVPQRRRPTDGIVRAILMGPQILYVLDFSWYTLAVVDNSTSSCPDTWPTSHLARGVQHLLGLQQDLLQS